MSGPLLLPTEIMAVLRISKSQFYRLARLGRIPAFRIGSDWRMTEEDLTKWIESQKKTRGNRENKPAYHV